MPNGIRSKPIDKPIGPDLAAMWQASKAAITHSRTIAQVGWFHWKAGVRGAIARILFAIAMAITAVAAAVTMAVWATNHLLAEISAALGGGLTGCVSAIAIMLGVAIVLFLSWHFVRSRTRSRLLAEKLMPQEGAQAEPDPEFAELDRIRRQAIADLRVDGDKISQHAGAILQHHPIATLSASAASGLIASRVIMAVPRTLRRSAMGALRLSTSAGIVGLFRPASAAEVPATAILEPDQQSA